MALYRRFRFLHVISFHLLLCWLHHESRPLDLIPHGKVLLGSCYETWLRGN